jgi:hypothetical protein
MDNFRFITNIKNPCGGGPTLDEFVQGVLQKEAAGKAAPCEEGAKGQVISLPADKEFQKGESVTGKKDGKKSKKEASGKAKAEGCKGEGLEISLPADKEFQKGESEDGSKVTPKNKKVKAEAKSKTKTASSKWVKISNLNDKQKGWLKKYWSVLYPREYVDAMIQDR